MLWRQPSISYSTPSHKKPVWGSRARVILENLHADLEPKRQYNGLPRCHGWIGAAKLLLVELPRAPTDGSNLKIWQAPGKEAEYGQPCRAEQNSEKQERAEKTDGPALPCTWTFVNRVECDRSW